MTLANLAARGVLPIVAVALACSTPKFVADDNDAGGQAGSAAGGAAATGGAAGASGAGAAGASGAGASGAGGTAGSDGGTNECGVGNTCAPSAPTGWTGPAIIGAAACGPGGLDVSTAAPLSTCGCTCTSVSCPLSISGLPKAKCGGSTCGSSFAFNSCTDLASKCATAQAVQVEGFSCSPKTNFNSQWNKTDTLCAPTPGKSCDGTSGLCMSAGKYCVYQQGDTACPAGAYSVKTLYYREPLEAETCSCACGAPDACGKVTVGQTNSTCTGTVTTFQLGGNGFCAVAKSISYLRSIVTAPCPPASTTPNLAPAAVTVCCQT